MEENRNTKVLRAGENVDEAALITLAKGGNKKAFGGLVRLHQKKLLRVIMAMTGDLDSAMDIVQDGFVRAWKAMDSFDETYPFYPWVSKIATNLAINYLKRSRRETSLDPADDYHQSPDGDPLQKLQLAENQKRFMAAVKALPEQYRAVFALRHFDDLSYDEIAKRLDISPGTVDSRLYRARQRLIEELKDLLD